MRDPQAERKAPMELLARRAVLARRWFAAVVAHSRQIRAEGVERRLLAEQRRATGVGDER